MPAIEVYARVKKILVSSIFLLGLSHEIFFSILILRWKGGEIPTQPISIFSTGRLDELEEFATHLMSPGGHYRRLRQCLHFLCSSARKKINQ